MFFTGAWRSIRPLRRRLRKVGDAKVDTPLADKFDVVKGTDSLEIGTAAIRRRARQQYHGRRVHGGLTQTPPGETGIVSDAQGEGAEFLTLARPVLKRPRRPASRRDPLPGKIRQMSRKPTSGKAVERGAVSCPQLCFSLVTF